jgi:hypothetical protein
MSRKFASGKWAYGISDRSGRRYRLKDMKREWNGLLVGPDEFEVKHPQLEVRQKVVDPQALKNPRPDRVEPLELVFGAPVFPSDPTWVQSEAVGSVGAFTVSLSTTWDDIEAAAVSTGALALYDFNNPDATTLRTSGDDSFFSAVADVLGNRVSYIKATEANQPQRALTSTGVYAADFGTASQALTLTAADSGDAIPQPYSVLVVRRHANPDNGETETIIGFTDAGVNPESRIRKSSGQVNGQSSPTGLNGATTLDDTWGVTLHVFNSTSSRIYFNGSLDAEGDAGTAGAAANTVTEIGVRPDVGAFFQRMDGEIALIVFYSGAKTPADLTALTDLINAYYPIGEAA